MCLSFSNYFRNPAASVIPIPYHSFSFVNFHVHFLLFFTLHRPPTLSVPQHFFTATALVVFTSVSPHTHPHTVSAAHERTCGHESDETDYTNRTAVAMRTTKTTASMSSSPFLSVFYLFLFSYHSSMQSQSWQRSLNFMSKCTSIYKLRHKKGSHQTTQPHNHSHLVRLTFMAAVSPPTTPIESLHT